MRIRWGGKNQMVNDSNDYGMSAAPSSGATQPSRIHVSAFQVREPDDDRSRAGSRPKRITVTIDGRAETANALLVTGNYPALARRHRADRTAPSRPTTTIRGAGRRHAERSLLADAVRGRSRRAGQNDQHQQSSGDHRRRDGAVIHRNAAGQCPLQDFTMPLRLDDQISGDDPRMNDATAWWVQMTGRLKPGITLAQVKGNLEPVSSSISRAPDWTPSCGGIRQGRSLLRNQGGPPIPRCWSTREPRVRVHDTDATQTRALGLHRCDRRARPDARLRERRESSALAGNGAQREISVRMSMARRGGGLSVSSSRKACCWRAWVTSPALLLARWGQRCYRRRAAHPPPADWRIVPSRGPDRAAGISVRHCTCAARRKHHGRRAQRAEGNRRGVAGPAPSCPLALLVIQVSISLVLLVGAGLFLTVSEQPAQRQRGLQSAESGVRPRRRRGRRAERRTQVPIRAGRPASPAAVPG